MKCEYLPDKTTAVLAFTCASNMYIRNVRPMLYKMKDYNKITLRLQKHIQFSSHSQSYFV